MTSLRCCSSWMFVKGEHFTEWSRMSKHFYQQAFEECSSFSLKYAKCRELNNKAVYTKSTGCTRSILRTRCPKKVDHQLMAATLSRFNRFSTLFCLWKDCEISSKAVPITSMVFFINVVAIIVQEKDVFLTLSSLSALIFTPALVVLSAVEVWLVGRVLTIRNIT